MIDIMEVILIVILMYRIIVIEKELSKTNKYIKKVESNIDDFKGKFRTFKSTLASSVDIDKNYNNGK